MCRTPRTLLVGNHTFQFGADGLVATPYAGFPHCDFSHEVRCSGRGQRWGEGWHRSLGTV